MGAPRYSGASNQFVVSLGSLDDPEKTVHAQYRPKELEITQSVPWAKHPTTAGALRLEFSGAEGRETSLELFLDESEVRDGTVAQRITTLHELATVRHAEKGERDDRKRRPHHCVLVFGDIYNKRPFQCVIQSIATKYTMFSPDGAPIRATVTLKLKESSFGDRELERWSDQRATLEETARKQDEAREESRLRVIKEKSEKAKQARQEEVEEERRAEEQRRAKRQR